MLNSSTHIQDIYTDTRDVLITCTATGDILIVQNDTTHTIIMMIFLSVSFGHMGCIFITMNSAP